jgi:hypothetical protein
MFKIIYGLIAIAFFGGTSLHAQGLKPHDTILTFESSIERVDTLVERPTGVLASQYVISETIEAKARFEWRNDAGAQFFVEPVLSVNHYPLVEDDHYFGVFAEFRHQLAFNDKMQLRWRGGVEQSHDTFTRFAAQLTLNTRASETRASQVILRYRFRDQDEAKTFSGYDQQEYFVAFQQVWMPIDSDFTQISGKVYADVRHADAMRFNYAELGAHLQVRLEPEPAWTVTATAKGFVRHYGDAFSTSYNFARQDRRLTIDLEASYDFGNGQTIAGAVGWGGNRSNVDIRDFSGATFRLEYAMQLN